MTSKPVSLLVELLRSLLRSRVRGSTRLTLFLSKRLRSLQNVPVVTPLGQRLWLDLRLASALGCFANPAQCEVPEQALMHHIVKPGTVVCDIGAHLGIWTCLLSQLVGQTGQVHAFEPNPFVLPTLQRSVDELGNVSLHRLALADRSGQVDFFVPADESMASLADWTQGEHGVIRAISCGTCRLDELVESGIVPFPDFIKCDVEGAERLVFCGSKKTLDRTDAPILFFETNKNTCNGFGLTQLCTIECLRALPLPKFEFFEVRPSCILRRLGTSIPSHTNILAIPLARMNRLGSREQMVTLLEGSPLCV